MDLTKRGLEAHLQRVVLDVLVHEQLQAFERALRQRLEKHVIGITIGHVKHVKDVLNIRQLPVMKGRRRPEAVIQMSPQKEELLTVPGPVLARYAAFSGRSRFEGTLCTSKTYSQKAISPFSFQPDLVPNRLRKTWESFEHPGMTS